MSMRYIIRRPKPEDFSDLSTILASKQEDLSSKLGAPGDNFKRTVSDTQSSMRVVNYRFICKKEGAGWKWLCPSIELVGETERDLIALTAQFGVGQENLKHIFSI